MRTISSILAGLLTLFLAHTASSQPLHFWSTSFGSTANDEANAVAVDGAGNSVIVGTFNFTVNLGGADLVSAGGNDIFIAKFTASGAHEWSLRFGSSSSDRGLAVAVDATGNVAVAGSFVGTVDFGGGNLVSQGGTDIFVAKYDADGTHIWSRRFGGVNLDEGSAVAMDNSGNVVLTGYFQDTADFGGGSFSGVGLNDMFLAKYDALGNHLWSKHFGNTGFDEGNGVAVDGSGNIAITGQFAGTVDFGGGNLVSTAGSADIIVAKYNASGVHQWSQRFGNAISEAGTAVDIDAAGHVVVTGFFLISVNFGGGVLTSAGGRDIFLAKFDVSGTHQWSKRFGSTASDDGNSVSTDSEGNAVLTGSFEGDVDFGGGSLLGAGGSDIFLAQYDANGAHLWSRGFGSVNDDVGYGTSIIGTSSVFLAGEYFGNVNFGGGTLVSAGNSDAFIAEYGSGVAEPGIVSILDIGNDQGRRVKVRFARSGYDYEGPESPVVKYEAYRRDDAPPASLTRGDAANLSARQLQADGWTEVGAVSAHAEPFYSIDVPTIGDSTITAGQYYSVFYIRAATEAPFTYFDSPIDSGYSLDNLAPGVPGGFAFASGVLSWNESSADDFDYFTVYGSNTSSFGSAALVDYTTTTDLDVTTAGYVFYFVTATDFSGNEGKPAAINTLSDVGGTPRSYVLSISAYPNPFNPGTTVRYTVPTKGRVTIAVYDVRGAHVTTLVDQEVEAGAHTVGWNGLDGRGNQAGSGMYFARVVSSGETRTYKMTLLK